MFHVCGDVHGLFYEFNKRSKVYGSEPIFVLGDVGVGFPKQKAPTFADNIFLIRGNHDNPTVFKTIPNAIPDYGSVSIDGYVVCYFSGAYSIDQQFRTEGLDWWRDEELSISEMNSALDFFEKEQPRIMLTHECPTKLIPSIHKNGKVIPSRTGSFLDSVMENVHSIDTWYFGHHHVSFDAHIDGVHFIGLNELEFKTVDI